ncbi:MAG: cysteine desulfurase [Acidobacteria bacterium]|nr:cysteine desulfurase [Acidobacteriota bacterium]
MFRRVYLDNSATTAIDPEVLDEMMPYLTDEFGNASSIHHFGQVTRSAVDTARHQVAGMLNARPNEIVFTSGGTESNNLAIRGLIEANGKHGNHIIISAIEHPAVKNVVEDLEERDFRATYLPVYEDGVVSLNDVEAAITEDTILISVMAANNEIGTLQPIAEIGRLVRNLRESEQKIWFHTDAVQAAGKMRLDVEVIGCDLLSISGHKIHAPKGIGALYIRRGVRLHPQNIGGRQERERRGGTEPVAQIVALGKACEIAERELGTAPEHLKALRDALEGRIGEMIADITFNGSREHRLPNISNISFHGVEGEGVLINLDMQGIAVSTGSACSSGSLEPSPVIRALCGNEDVARSAIRFSLGRLNTAADIDRVLEVLPSAVENLRRLSPNHKYAAK